MTLAEDVLHCLSQLVSRVSDSLCVEVRVHRAPHTKVTQAPMIKLLNLASFNGLMLFGHQYFSKKCHLWKQVLTPIWADSLISVITMDHIENDGSAIGMNGDALGKGVTGA